MGVSGAWSQVSSTSQVTVLSSRQRVLVLSGELVREVSVDRFVAEIAYRVYAVGN